MAGLLADVRSGLRVLRSAPSFAVAVIGTLALGIGATTAVFSVVDRILLRALRVEDQTRLLVVWTSRQQQGDRHWPFSYTSYEGMRERLRTTSGIAAHPYAGTLPTVLHLDDGSAMPLQRAAVKGEWFSVLGVRPRVGRLLTDADDHLGAPPVIVLSSRLAERLFGSVSHAVGHAVDAPGIHELQGRSVRVLCAPSFGIAMIERSLRGRTPSGYLQRIAVESISVAERQPLGHVHVEGTAFGRLLRGGRRGSGFRGRICTGAARAVARVGDTSVVDRRRVEEPLVEARSVTFTSQRVQLGRRHQRAGTVACGGVLAFA